MNKKEISESIAAVSNYLYEKGLVPGKSGNISCKFSENGVKKVAITPSGVSLKSVTPEEIVIVDMDGNKIDEVMNQNNKRDKKPSSEVFMHLKVYKNRNDVKSVVHTHSPIATGFAFAGVEIKRLEGFGPIENTVIPLVDYAAPGTMDLAENVAKGMEKEDIVSLKNHGIVACGENLDEAALLTEFVEESAKIQFVTSLISAN
ncbi:class II aldolase/adducin family protein [Methanobacterium aggregans]|uniref:class II aldolase/adducin family protein n=1 Tax=Methanobacterium aggregans TaxID=1615586 RepID=UPI001AE49341|nr:class II aldolase/adducin family protein [Methanobacterium aggregans]MBP2045970.1 L-fuculose-phosphate aldolase [Methanobacterium aggregans]